MNIPPPVLTPRPVAVKCPDGRYPAADFGVYYELVCVERFGHFVCGRLRSHQTDPHRVLLFQYGDKFIMVIGGNLRASRAGMERLVQMMWRYQEEIIADLTASKLDGSGYWLKDRALKERLEHAKVEMIYGNRSGR